MKSRCGVFIHGDLKRLGGRNPILQHMLRTYCNNAVGRDLTNQHDSLHCACLAQCSHAPKWQGVLAMLGSFFRVLYDITTPNCNTYRNVTLQNLVQKVHIDFESVYLLNSRIHVSFRSSINKLRNLTIVAYVSK